MTIDELHGEISKNRQRFATEKARILTDKHLSESGRREQIKALKTDSDAKHDALRQQLTETRETERQKLRQRAFGVSTRSGEDRNGAEMNYRQALAQAEGAKDLPALIRRADTTGDRLLKRAALAVAAERGEWGVIDQHGDESAREYVGWERQHGDLRSTGRRLSDSVAASGPQAA